MFYSENNKRSFFNPFSFLITVLFCLFFHLFFGYFFNRFLFFFGVVINSPVEITLVENLWLPVGWWQKKRTRKIKNFLRWNFALIVRDRVDGIFSSDHFFMYVIVEIIEWLRCIFGSWRNRRTGSFNYTSSSCWTIIVVTGF